MEINNTSQSSNMSTSASKPNIVNTPSYPTTPQINQRGFVPVIIGAILLIIIVGGGAYYLGIQKGQSNMQDCQLNVNNPSDGNPSPTVNNTSNPTTPVNPKSNWQSYTIKTFGVQFKLPPTISKKGDLKENVIPGEKGTVYCVTFPQQNSGLIKQVYAGAAGCSIFRFGIGTTSVDFQAGRSGGFTDFQGYEYKNGKYYGKFPGGNSFEIPSDIVREFISDSGVKMVKVIGKRYKDGPSPYVNEGSIGALVNTTNPTYTGFAIQLDLNEGFTEADFDQILSTFQFLN